MEIIDVLVVVGNRGFSVMVSKIVYQTKLNNNTLILFRVLQYIITLIFSLSKHKSLNIFPDFAIAN